ncbi:MAG TPA: NADH-quinone oxidoreductase subunit NuoE [Erysipelotrichaceae bacterium]|nr:NADH-quinone oxidoreductase subunit NuoE [Erysipelotrichaceae bacterium]
MAVDEKRKLEEITKELEKINDKSELLEILHKTQDIYGYIPKHIILLIAKTLDTTVASIYGVITFYSRFSLIPKGKYDISVCMGTACYVKGANDVLEAFAEELEIKPGETTSDMKFSLTATRCLGACGLAPVITINEDVHGKLKPEDVKKVLQQYK